MNCALEFFNVIQGEDRDLVLRIINADGTPFDLTGATEIRARFKKTDGQTVEKRLSEGAITIVSPTVGRLQVSLTSLDTQSLFVAERMDFSVLIDKGVKATGAIAPYTFECTTPGLEGNAISLTFDGIQTVDAIVSAYNDSVSYYEVAYTGGDGSDVLPAQTLTLSGGTSSRRKVNFRRGITVERQAQ